jgi:hypothetical protein
MIIPWATAMSIAALEYRHGSAGSSGDFALWCVSHASGTAALIYVRYANYSQTRRLGKSPGIKCSIPVFWHGVNQEDTIWQFDTFQWTSNHWTAEAVSAGADVRPGFGAPVDGTGALRKSMGRDYWQRKGQPTSTLTVSGHVPTYL